MAPFCITEVGDCSASFARWTKCCRNATRNTLPSVSVPVRLTYRSVHISVIVIQCNGDSSADQVGHPKKTAALSRRYAYYAACRVLLMIHHMMCVRVACCINILLSYKDSLLSKQFYILLRAIAALFMFMTTMKDQVRSIAVSSANCSYKWLQFVLVECY